MQHLRLYTVWFADESILISAYNQLDWCQQYLETTIAPGWAERSDTTGCFRVGCDQLRGKLHLAYQQYTFVIQEGTLHEDCFSIIDGAFVAAVLVRSVATSGILVPVACGLSPLSLILFHAGTDWNGCMRKLSSSTLFLFVHIGAPQLTMTLVATDTGCLFWRGEAPRPDSDASHWRVVSLAIS